MNSLSDFLGGSKPKLITAYTSGTGTYIPTANMARCFVRLQAGGGGGNAGNYGGGGGAMTEWFIRIPIAGLAYTVGAGGAVGNDGSPTLLGLCTALAGKAGASGGSVGGTGGVVGYLMGGTDADGATITTSGLQGVSGGGGGYTSASPGNVAGYPVAQSHFTAQGSGPWHNIGNGLGNGSGGNSFYGLGGTPGNSPAAGNYGAGGGNNAAGAGGYIEIWDYGA